MAYRFGDFELDPRLGTLTGPHGPVALRRQAFRLCQLLVERAPELLDRDTLLDEVWGRTALSPNVLPQTMSELRQALGDDPQAPRYIETLHRRGYRFICPVTRAGGEPAAAPDMTPVPARRRAWPARVGLASTFLAVAALVTLSYGSWQRESALRNLHAQEIPHIRKTAEQDIFGAWRLARDARERFPDDPTLAQLWLDLSLPVPLHSEPPGAEIAVHGYARDDADWVVLGRAPLDDVRLPLTMLRFRVSLEGHEPLEVAPSVLPTAVPFHLHPAGAGPEDMVYVPGGPVQYLGKRMELPGFWIGRHEVTNREYLEFVRAGGYRDQRFWRHPVVLEGATLPHEEAMALFVDSTGMPGPATWAMGTFPPGEADHPVEGVSWYEAAAYAEYAGHALPTVFHWWRAAGLGTAQAQNFSDILAASNFGGRGTAPVGSHSGIGPHGTLDMAGNVAEWCANPAGENRHLLGGSWLTDVYAYSDPFAQPALERRPGFGIRLVHVEQPVAPGLSADISPASRELPPPVDDQTFALYRRLYDYDATPLEPVLEEVDTSHDSWRRERVVIDAAYGSERLPVQVFLPKDAEPPLQAVVVVPGGDALMLDSSRDAGLMHVEAFIRSGRAVIYPVYQGTFERKGAMPAGPIELRNQLIQQVKDLRRTLDYLETRDDIDMSRVALYGLSYGGWRAPYMLAVEDRLAAAIIVAAGVTSRPLPPEIQQQDYLARVRLPVLLITGRTDFAFPYQESQRLFFQRLGTADADKEHVVLDWGHLPPGFAEVVRLMLRWADQQLGSP